MQFRYKEKHKDEDKKEEKSLGFPTMYSPKNSLPTIITVKTHDIHHGVKTHQAINYFPVTL